MNIRNFISLLILTTCIGTAFSQKIQFKYDKVFINNSPIFYFEKIHRGDQLRLTSIQDSHCQIIINYDDNQSSRIYEDDFITISFENWNISMQSKSNSGTWKHILRWMYNSNLIDDRGQLAEHRVTQFCKRFNENISSFCEDHNTKLANKF